MADNSEVSNTVIGSPRRAARDLWRIVSDAELRGLMFFAVILLMVGSTFYMVVEGWDLVEAIYFSVATLTTVGYGDLHPTNDLSRLFTAVYILFGVGFLLSALMRVARLANRPVVKHLNSSRKGKRP